AVRIPDAPPTIRPAVGNLGRVAPDGDRGGHDQAVAQQGPTGAVSIEADQSAAVSRIAWRSTRVERSNCRSRTGAATLSGLAAATARGAVRWRGATVIRVTHQAERCSLTGSASGRSCPHAVPRALP